MPTYIWFALLGSLALACSALLVKIIVRYRLCNPGLITWGAAAASGLIGMAVLAAFPRFMPGQAIGPTFGLAACLTVGSWLLNKALQEGDVSTVAPLLGTKIVFTSFLAFLIFDEQYGPAVYIAVAASGVAVACFGLGKPAKAQGGYGKHPAVSMVLACLASLAYAGADQFAKLGMAHTDFVTVTVYSSILSGLAGVIFMLRRHYRRYRLGKIEYIMLTGTGGLFFCGMLGLYVAFSMSGGVTIPNVILGTRGMFVLIVGYILSRAMHTPMELQPVRIYLLRAAGTLLLFVALLLILL